MRVWLLSYGQILIGLILVAASYHKLTNRRRFEQIVHGYQLLPPAAVRSAGIVVPAGELVTGCLLIVPVCVPIAALAAAAWFLVFASAVAVNLARGRHIECGCFGFKESTPIQATHVVQNGLLAIVATLVAGSGARAQGSSIPVGDYAAAFLAATLTLGCVGLWRVAYRLWQSADEGLRLQKPQT